ncbi:MAG: pilus assembly protein [Dehalococcoidia bacterium]|nr:pilus assembly protein [Dehalococcoidia bacterium]
MHPLRTIRRILRPGHRREEGQAAFEFLLVLPFFILFLLMAVDFGVLMYKYVSVSNAVREGARYAAVNCGDGECSVIEIEERVLERSGGILGNAADVHVAWESSNEPGRGTSVVVRVCHRHELLFFPAFNFNVTSTADMRLEQRDKGTGLPTSAGCS